MNNSFHIKRLVVCLVLLTAHPFFAQNSPDLIPFRSGEKWGYVDASGQKVIDYQYDDAYKFQSSKNIAKVSKAGKWGCINTKNETILAPEYQDIKINPKNGYLKVKKDDKWNVFTPSGRRLMVKWYDEVGWPTYGMIAVRQDRGPDSARIKKWGFVDKSKIPKIRIMYDRVGNFQNGVAMVQLGKKYGFIKTNGKYLIEPIFVAAHTFREGRAAYAENDGMDEKKRIPFKKWGFINTKGQRVISAKYRVVYPFYNYLASAIDINGNAGHIDTAGKTITPFIYHETRDFQNGACLVRQFNEWGFVDSTGKEIISPQYSYARPFKEGLAGVKKFGRWGFIDKTDSTIIKFQFYSVQDFSEGFAAFRDSKSRRWGFVDQQGIIKIQDKYQIVKPFQQGIALVKYNGKWGYIDKNGKEYWE